MSGLRNILNLEDLSILLSANQKAVYSLLDCVGKTSRSKPKKSPMAIRAYYDVQFLAN